MFNATDQLKHKLEKLMANPEKPVEIPKKKDKKSYEGPDFVRNIMGSSAGAGSGEFHVYRHLRRKEYARQKEMEIEAKQDTLNDEYHHKLEQNRRLAEERTAKKRNKRLKKKAKLKRKKTEKPATDASRDATESDESDSESNQSSPGRPVESADKAATRDEAEEESLLEEAPSKGEQAKEEAPSRDAEEPKGEQ